MKTIKKITTLVVLVIMVLDLNIGASAQNYTPYNFSFSGRGCFYTPLVNKDNNSNYATVYINNQNATASIYLQICDSNHRPVSATITIAGNTNSIYSIQYSYPLIAGKAYCLAIDSGYYGMAVSGYWIP